jgi:hypothetical protein
MSGQEWRFQQLSGPGKVLTLSGYAAPFGRPRQKPVVEEGHKERITTYRYPGKSGTPTRHFFGDEWEDISLNGRWMDRDLGAGGANEKIDEWDDFISDRRQCQISWGNIVSFKGVIEKLKVSRESAEQVAWHLHILVDEKVGTQRARAEAPPELTEDFLVFSQTVTTVAALPRPSIPDWNPTFLDKIGALISIVAAASASVIALVNTIENFRTASLAELNRLKGSLRQFKTAFITFNETMASLGVTDSLYTTANADAEIKLQVYEAEQAVLAIEMMAILADLNRKIDIVHRGRQVTSYVAKAGDTWESISTVVYGGVDGAAVIRSGNGIRYGEAPEAGRTYNIPLNV